jgi:hypothetical protein
VGGNVIERIAEIVVLGEDLRHSNFARRYLERDGHNKRNIRIEISPSGRGSGEQYVREHYPVEVKHYRSRSQHRKAALVTVIDADTGSVASREVELETELTSAGERKREKTEKIALLIPKRHIETWLLCLTRITVEELADYRNTREVDTRTKDAANTFYDWSRTGYSVPEHCVPSLQQGLQEIRRID